MVIMPKYLVKRIWEVEASDTLDALMKAKPGYHIKTTCEVVENEYHT